MARLQAPCKDCINRELGCHSKCEKYQEYCRLNSEQKEELYKERLLTMQIIEMNNASRKKTKRH